MADSLVVYILAVTVIGSRMRALGNLLHEAAHRKLFRSKFLNDFTGGLLCAWPLGIGYLQYVKQHRLHHVYLWDENRDPDVSLYRLTRTETGSSNSCTRRRFWIVHVVFAALPVMPWRRLRDDLAGNRRRLLKLVVAVLAMAGLQIWEHLWIAQIVLLYWLVPFLTSYQTITYWAELGEHGGMRNLGRLWGSRNWRGNIMSRWLIGPHSDDAYHLLHHWFPSVPHYRLAEVDSICTSGWPQYAGHPRCDGFFLSSDRNRSVINDMWVGVNPA
ncbi:fatty acid desaturase family protein [Nocardia sp. NBC_01377]|uniref:fatty acid desaturase family protein n=1 Tax=Nocardia sp. NBC_01377 TaxID=2903595 RepID=UPI00386996D9